MKESVYYWTEVEKLNFKYVIKRIERASGKVVNTMTFNDKLSAQAELEKINVYVS